MMFRNNIIDDFIKFLKKGVKVFHRPFKLTQCDILKATFKTREEANKWISETKTELNVRDFNEGINGLYEYRTFMVIYGDWYIPHIIIYLKEYE